MLNLQPVFQTQALSSGDQNLMNSFFQGINTQQQNPQNNALMQSQRFNQMFHNA